MKDLTSIPGVTARELQPPGTTITVTRLALAEHFSDSSAIALIASIDEGSRLTFFDAEHPQRSDPGLYVSLQRRDGQLFTKGANHGWSYPWLAIDDRQAARWLWMCREANTADGRHETSTMQLLPGSTFIAESEPEAGAGFFRWLNERLTT